MDEKYFVRHQWAEGRRKGRVSTFRSTQPLSREHPDGAPEEVGSLTYKATGKGSRAKISIDEINVHPDHRRKGLASRMMDRLQGDYPEHTFDHGWRSGDGNAWWNSYGNGAGSNGRTDGRH